MFDKVRQYVIDGWLFLRYLIRHFVDDSCQTTAAALTYQTLFAVVPFITVMYTVLSAFEDFSLMGRAIEDFVFSNIVPENIAVVQDYLRSFSEQARKLSFPSAALLVVTASLMLLTIERTFNEIWQIREPRHGFQRAMMYWGVLTVGPLLIVGGLAVTTYMLSLPLVSDVTESPYFLWFIPLGLTTLTFTLICVAVPNTKVSVRHAVFGGIIVAIVFELAKLVFSYVMGQSSFQVIYGTFAAVPLFLLWVYVSWTIVLMGAELVKGLGVYRFKGDHQLESPLLQYLVILEVFYRAHQKGEVVLEKDIARLSSRIDLERWTDYRGRLMDLNLIKAVERGGLVLTRDLRDFTVWALYNALDYPLPAAAIGNNSDWEKSLSATFEAISGRNQGMLDVHIEGLFRGEYPELPS